MATIFDLPNFVEKLSDTDKKDFFSIFSFFESKIPFLYESEEQHKHIAKILDLPLSEINARKTISVSNLVFNQQALFNPLRAKRPVQTSNPPISSNSSCDFCQAANKTPSDPFGRIKGKYSVTAANAAAYIGLHSLIIPNVHNLSEISEDIFLDLMKVINKWFEKANQTYPKAIFPSIIWNSSHRAGASLPHPHLQVFLSEMPFQKPESLQRNILNFEKNYSKPFVETFYEINNKLNLVINTPVKAISHLAPVRSSEMLVFDKNNFPNENLSKSLFSIFQFFMKEGKTNFNMAIYLPPLNTDKSGFPLLARFAERGKTESLSNDVGAVELFLASVITSDPFQVAQDFKKYLV